MARRLLMLRLARWHIWLGWIAAVPIVLWIATGLFMALRPIEEVRGEALRVAPAPVSGKGLVPPQEAGLIKTIALRAEPDYPVWIVTAPDGAVRRFDARTGQPLGPVGVDEARRIARASYAAKADLASLTRFPADAPPLDLRRSRPAWQAHFADGTNLYVDADSGEVLALRTRWWRLYDVMWGLHIMDPVERENASHPLLWVLATLSLLTSVFGTILLLRRRRARRLGATTPLA